MGFYATAPLQGLTGGSEENPSSGHFAPQGLEPDPFGNLRHVSGTLVSNPWQYSSKWWDQESGLGYWGYRWYEPVSGRWLSRDPIGELGGVNNYILRSVKTRRVR